MDISTDDFDLMELTAADVTLRPAIPDEATTLSDITWRSKGYWGYDEEHLRNSGELLNIKSSFIEKSIVYVSEHEGQITGFYGLSDEEGIPHLLYLQVDPAFSSRGLGKILWHHAVQQARLKGWNSFLIQADHHSEPFFLLMGAQKKEGESSDLLEFSV